MRADEAEKKAGEKERELEATKKRPLAVDARELLEDIARGSTTLRITAVQRIDEDDIFILSPRTTR